MKTLKELLAEAKSIVDAISAGNATEDQMKRMSSLREEIDDAKARQEDVKSLSGLLTPGAGREADEDEGGEKSARNLGEHVALGFKSPAFGAFKHNPGASFVAPEFKAPADPTSFDPTEGGLPTVERGVNAAIRTELTVASLFSQGTLDGDSLVYLEEIPLDAAARGAAQTVAPGGKKPYVRFEYKQVREGVSKIAALTKILDEMVEDYAFLVTEINTNLVYEVQLEEERQLLSGDGTGANVNGLFNRSGLLSVAATAENLDEKIFSAMMQVRTVSQRTVDGLVISPADYEALRLRKDGNGQFLAGGPFQGQYGVGGTALYPPLWGLATVVTPALEQGTILTGAFKSATILRKGGIRVDMTNSNVDDFETNKVTLRAEKRLGFKVPRPSAFAKITIGGTGGGGE